VPLQFELTSASVMNVFFIPQLGSMIYTMNGMTSRLNLRACTGNISRPPGAFKRLAKTIGISSIRSSILTDGFAINKIAAMLEMSRTGPHWNPNVRF
jgi:hypothetical protein